jgi:hypothetical protein
MRGPGSYTAVLRPGPPVSATAAGRSPAIVAERGDALSYPIQLRPAAAVVLKGAHEAAEVLSQAIELGAQRVEALFRGSCSPKYHSHLHRSRSRSSSRRAADLGRRSRCRTCRRCSGDKRLPTCKVPASCCGSGNRLLPLTLTNAQHLASFNICSLISAVSAN